MSAAEGVALGVMLDSPAEEIAALNPHLIPSVHPRRFFGLYAALALAGFAAVFAGSWFARAHTLTRTVPVVRAPASAAALVKAWGSPDSSVDGATVNPQLAGTTCAVYQSRRAIICYAA